MKRIEEFIKTLPCDAQDFLRQYFRNAPRWLMESFRMIEMPADQRFVEEGADADSVYILLKGRVSAIDYRVFDAVYKHYEFYPVEVFGAMEIIGEIESYMTTLTTVETSAFLKTSRRLYKKWLDEDDNAFRMQAHKIEVSLLRQVRKERLNVLLGGTERVEMMLCNLYEACSADRNSTVYLSRRQFVETTGLSERTVSRILKDFEMKGLLSRKGWDIVVTPDQYQKMREELNIKLDDIRQ